MATHLHDDVGRDAEKLPGTIRRHPASLLVTIGIDPLRSEVRRVSLGLPPVSEDLILRLQKYRDLTRVPRPIREAAALVVPEALALAEPEAVVWRGPVTQAEPSGRVVLDGHHVLNSRGLADLLRASSEAYVAVVTVGSRIEERARVMVEEQLLVEGLFMDTAAWAALIMLGQRLRRTLMAEERPAGRSLTHRLAPGYLDWPVTEQSTLLGVFQGAPLPVRVTEASWLIPVKSISGVFGIVPAR